MNKSQFSLLPDRYESKIKNILQSAAIRSNSRLFAPIRGLNSLVLPVSRAQEILTCVHFQFRSNKGKEMVKIPLFAHW